MIIVAEDASNKKVITPGPAREVRVEANRVLTAPLRSAVRAKPRHRQAEASENGRRTEGPGDAVRFVAGGVLTEMSPHPATFCVPQSDDARLEFKHFLRLLFGRDTPQAAWVLRKFGAAKRVKKIRQACWLCTAAVWLC
jgi:hypothetical protein